MNIVDNRNTGANEIPCVGDIIQLSNGTLLLIVRDNYVGYYRLMDLRANKILGDKYHKVEQCVEHFENYLIIRGENIKLVIDEKY